MQSRTIAYFELTAATFFIGSSLVVGKWTTMQMPVFLSQAACLVFALLLLLPLAAKKHKASWRVGRKDLLYLSLQALLGMFLFRVFMLYGLKTSPVTIGGILTSATPAAIGLLSVIFLKEKITARLGGGILCALLGIVCIQLPGWLTGGGSGPQAASLPGVLLILGAVTCDAMLTVLRKMTTSRVSSLLGTTYVTSIAFLLFLPFALAEAARFDFTAVNAADIGLLFYYGIFVTAVAYILLFRGVSRVSAGTAAVFTGLIPVSTVLLAYVLLGEKFSFTHVAGGSFVFLGIWLVSKKYDSPGCLPKKRPKERDGLQPLTRLAEKIKETG